MKTAQKHLNTPIPPRTCIKIHHQSPDPRHAPSRYYIISAIIAVAVRAVRVRSGDQKYLMKPNTARAEAYKPPQAIRLYPPWCPANSSRAPYQDLILASSEIQTHLLLLLRTRLLCTAQQRLYPVTRTARRRGRKQQRADQQSSRERSEELESLIEREKLHALCSARGNTETADWWREIRGEKRWRKQCLFARELGLFFAPRGKCGIPICSVYCVRRSLGLPRSWRASWLDICAWRRLGFVRLRVHAN